MTKSECRELGACALLAVLVIILLWQLTAEGITILWFGGAAGLGLLSGFITGASTKEGTAAELMGFVSGGIIVPLLGGIAAFLKQKEQTKEDYSYFSGTELLKQKTVVVDPLSDTPWLHPLGVAGSFFLVFSVFAIVGVALGVRRRNEKVGSGPGGIFLAGAKLIWEHPLEGARSIRIERE